MSNTNENKLYLLIILAMIFFIPFYFAWHYNEPDKNSIVDDISLHSMPKKTKAKIKHVDETEYNQIFKDRFQQNQPLMFNESNHSLDAVPLIHQAESHNDTLAHEELLEQLHIHKKRVPRILQPRQTYPRNTVKRVVLHKHIEYSSEKPLMNNALENIHSIHEFMHEKLQTAMLWQRHAVEQAQRFIQHYEQHRKIREATRSTGHSNTDLAQETTT